MIPLRNKVLPPKLSIKQIQDYLEMDKHSLHSAHQQLCEFVNNGDFVIYLANGTIVENINYVIPLSMVDPDYDATTDPKPFIVNGIEYAEDEFYGLRNEIYAFRNNDLNHDNLDAKFHDSPDYLDPENKYYSEEMHLAMQLHHAIYIEKYGDYNVDRQATVAAWLDANKPELKPSEAMIKRLSTIRLPHEKKRT